MEQLTHNCVRIETILHTGVVSTGTGFYMNLVKENETYVPVIITNKHVIKDSLIGKFNVTLAKEDGLPDLGNHRQFHFSNFEQMCIPHPNPNVDLAAFPIAPLVTQVEQTGDKLFFVPLETDLIPTDEERKSYSSMEDIVMIGYPNGIWDSINNLPVIRKGITATHPYIPWNGKNEFLTDIASFPGSSGSPVFLANIGGYMDNKGNMFMGTHRIKLLGIHYAGAMHTASGQIQIVTAPTSNIPIPITQIPNNIGVAINSKEILELEIEIKRLLGL